MDTRIASLAREHHGLVRRATLVEAGWSDRQIQCRLATGRLCAVHPGVYAAPGAPNTREQRLLAACWATGADGVASHRSAAWLWGLDGPFADTVEVTVPRPRKSRPRGAIVHRSGDLVDKHVTRRRGVPTTNPLRTLVDLGAVVPQPVLDRAVDDALGKGLVTVPGLLVILDQVGRRGRPGVGSLRRSLAERTDVPSSVLEAEFQRLVRRSGLPAPVYQHELRDASHRFVARMDAVYPDEALAIELDGFVAHSGRHALRHDLQRQNRIVECGLTLLRFTWHDVVGTPERTAATIERLLRRHHDERGLSIAG